MKLTEDKLRKMIREEMADLDAIGNRIEGSTIQRAGSGIRDSIFILTLDDGTQVTFQATRNGLEVDLN